jgi:hypothetical protein
LFRDFIKQISYTFPIDLFKSTIDEMSDHRFISTTFMMSMIMTLLIVAITNPSKEIYGYFYWITQSINDYHSHITPIKGESKESKNERIMVANKALYEVIEYMHTIINKSRIELVNSYHVATMDYDQELIFQNSLTFIEANTQ